MHVTVLDQTLPIPLSGSSLLQTKEHLYLLGGVTAYGEEKAPTAVILKASKKNPVQWLDTGHRLPTPVSHAHVLHNDDSVELVGGRTSTGLTDKVWKASDKDLNTWELTHREFTQRLVNRPVVRLGGYLYLIGGHDTGPCTDTICAAPVKEDYMWTKLRNVTLPYLVKDAVLYVHGYHVLVIGGMTPQGPVNSILKLDLTK